MGGPTSFAALNAGFAVDLTDMDAFTKRLNDLSAHFGPIFKKVAPVFGAYMRYSAVLEFGWRDKRMANFHVRGGGTVASDSGVPHIYPAVKRNLGYICDVLLDVNVKPLVDKVLSGKSSLSTATEIGRLERAWAQALNSRPRIEAVNNAPYRYGFHRRSIQGSAYPLNTGDIVKMRAEAERGYARKNAMNRAKSLAKKRGGRVLNPEGL